MKYKGWKTILGDLPDKENPVADVYYENNQIFQIFKEDNTGYTIIFANNPGANYWEFPYNESIEVLQEAKDHLSKLQRTPEQQEAYEARMKELENWNPTPEETAEYERKMEEQRKKYYG
ncbi:hypothetical protein [Candidatus Neptunichlamydia sp. REUL1]|uniref:hypothetical protein n=1 Tax=Candidatus Neptunichlamydia sp. REUL1 TaxID=3064277 RepID=UPI00292F3085|nr:hypothetical protein [Candidatus Neptunochlamydia sp. REUL1]